LESSAGAGGIGGCLSRRQHTWMRRDPGGATRTRHCHFVESSAAWSSYEGGGARRTAAQLAQEYRSRRGETEPHVEDAATSMKASRRGVRMEAVARGAPRRSWTDRSRRGRLDPETERSSRLRRAEARLSGEDVTGAVSRSAVSASARRRRSGVEPLLSLLPFYPFPLYAAHRMRMLLFQMFQIFSQQRLVRFGLHAQASGRWPFVVSSR